MTTYRIRWRTLGWQALAGFCSGYLVLHPISMEIFQYLDPRIAAAMHHGTHRGFVGPIAHSFNFEHLPMGLVFGLVAALIATFYGYHRLVLTFQRDRLAEELRRNELLRATLAEQAGQLKQQNEDLVRLELTNRRGTQFMAHDFKNALGCISTFAHVLLETPALRQDPNVANALTCIRRQAHRMAGSVVDLLQLARVRERGAPVMERISVGDLLHEAVGDFSLPAHTEHIAVGSRHEDCPPVWANRELLRRVLCNLIANAIKHNGPGAQVWVDAHAEETGQEVVFSCRDNGAGIRPEVLPSLFQEFAATDGSSRGSTGLGLAFCKTTVEAHKGRIWCE
ncbi:MAG: sensor histidine kinase, partial [Isosphaeraceae bacterium]